MCMGQRLQQGQQPAQYIQNVGTSRLFHILVRNTFSPRLMMPHFPLFSQVFCRPKGSAVISWHHCIQLYRLNKGLDTARRKEERLLQTIRGKGGKEGMGWARYVRTCMPLTPTHDGTFTSVFSRVS